MYSVLTKIGLVYPRLHQKAQSLSVIRVSQKELLILRTIVLVVVDDNFSMIVGGSTGDIDHLAGERNTGNAILKQKYEPNQSGYLELCDNKLTRKLRCRRQRGEFSSESAYSWERRQ